MRKIENEISKEKKMKDLISRYHETRNRYYELCEKANDLKAPDNEKMEKNEITLDEWCDRMEEIDVKSGTSKAFDKAWVAKKELIEKGLEEFQKLARNDEEREMLKGLKRGLYMPSIREKILDLILKSF